MGGRLVDWLGQGAAVDRPAAASVAGLTNSQGAAIYFANDTKILSFYDHTGPSWFDVDITAVSAISFQTLPDVDWSTPPTDGQLFVWDTALSKLKPITLPSLDTEDVQDIVGGMFINGTGITASYDDPTGMILIDCTITQYTDELAMDALSVAFAAGTHIGINVNYDDALNKFDFELDASIDLLTDVDITTTPPVVDDVLKWDGSKFIPGVSSTVGSIDDLSDVDTTTAAPAAGDMMQFDGINWVPAPLVAGVFQPTEPSAADFSVLRTGTAMAAMVITDNADKGVKIVNNRSSTGSNWKQAYALKPVTAVPFRAEARIANPQQSTNDFFMIGLTISTSNAADVAKHLSIRWLYSNSIPYVGASHKNTGLNTIEAAWTTVTSGYAMFSQTTELWIAVEWTGTTINGYISHDKGASWVLVASEPDSFFTGDPDLVGFGWEGVSSDGGNHTNWCDHFYITNDLGEPMGVNRISPLQTVLNVSGFNAQVGTTYTPDSGDADGIVEISNAAPITVTIPPSASEPYDLYTSIEFHQGAAGVIHFVPGVGVTLQSRGTALYTAGQHAVAVARKIGSDTWRLAGDLVP